MFFDPQDEVSIYVTISEEEDPRVYLGVARDGVTYEQHEVGPLDVLQPFVEDQIDGRTFEL